METRLCGCTLRSAAGAEISKVEAVADLLLWTDTKRRTGRNRPKCCATSSVVWLASPLRHLFLNETQNQKPCCTIGRTAITVHVRSLCCTVFSRVSYFCFGAGRWARFSRSLS